MPCSGPRGPLRAPLAVERVGGLPRTRIQRDEGVDRGPLLVVGGDAREKRVDRCRERGRPAAIAACSSRMVFSETSKAGMRGRGAGWAAGSHNGDSDGDRDQRALETFAHGARLPHLGRLRPAAAAAEAARLAGPGPRGQWHSGGF